MGQTPAFGVKRCHESREKVSTVTPWHYRELRCVVRGAWHAVRARGHGTRSWQSRGTILPGTPAWDDTQEGTSAAPAPPSPHGAPAPSAHASEPRVHRHPRIAARVSPAHTGGSRSPSSPLPLFRSWWIINPHSRAGPLSRGCDFNATWIRKFLGISGNFFWKFQGISMLTS